MTIKLEEIARRVGGTLHGAGGLPIAGVNSLAEAGPEELTFVTDARHGVLAGRTQAAAVLAPRGFAGEISAARIEVDDVEAALEVVLTAFSPAEESPTGIHPSAVIDPAAELGEGVAVEAGAVIEREVSVGAGSVVGANCVLRRGVRIGRDCRLGANTVIDRACRLGDRVVIGPNCTIGTAGFGYRMVEGRHVRVPHAGTVVIEDDVEMGASCCVDRAKFGSTVVGAGTKIDNLVQVAHNVRIGRHCILVSQVGIAGSSRLGDYVVLGGQVGVADHVAIGEGAQVGAQGGVLADIPAGERMIGSPARPARRALREIACVQKLPEVMAELQGRGKRTSQGGEKDR